MEEEKKVKKEIKHRGASEWNKLCAKVREENKGMKAGDVFKLAKSIRDKEKEEKK